MLKPIYLVLIFFGFLLSQLAPAAETPTSFVAPGKSTQPAENTSFYEEFKKKFGITYFSFIYGPGIIEKTYTFSPNQLGKPENDGISAQNQISLRYKFSENMALDFQFRTRLFFTNGTQNENFNHVRWEAPRIGISGKLLAGEDWSLVGAINTDFPYFLPPPLTGYQAQLRTVIFNPGMFANFRYEPRSSRWSIFSVVSPRYFFYTDRSAGDPQLSRGGFIPENKPELLIAFQPTLNYRLSTKTKLTLGSTIDYRKQVISDWNPFEASLLSNGTSNAWRLFAIPLSLGVSYILSPAITVFPFISTYPIAIQRKDAATGRQASFLEASSLGMWINGTIF